MKMSGLETNRRKTHYGARSNHYQKQVNQSFLRMHLRMEKLWIFISSIFGSGAPGQLSLHSIAFLSPVSLLFCLHRFHILAFFFAMNRAIYG
jgi:hypothetical protein